MEHDKGEDLQTILGEIDELHTAIANLSQFPVATRALLSSLEERYNAYDFAIHQLAEREEQKFAQDSKTV